jgi:hypothetical protein
MPVSTLPSQSFVWGELPDRFMAELKASEAELWEHGGITKMFGPVGDNYAGASEGNLLTEQVLKFLLNGIALDLENRERENRIGRSVGRPKDVITPYLAPEMLGLFLCYQGCGGRHSVATSIGGELKQEETGPLFNFFKTGIRPANRFLVDELHRTPLSASRLARYALAERKRSYLRTIERANYQHRFRAKTILPNVAKPDADRPSKWNLSNMWI